jgi:hypothetical protein
MSNDSHRDQNGYSGLSFSPGKLSLLDDVVVKEEPFSPGTVEREQEKWLEELGSWFDHNDSYVEEMSTSPKRILSNKVELYFVCLPKMDTFIMM